jgi:anti-anti-sigma factor
MRPASSGTQTVLRQEVFMNGAVVQPNTSAIVPCESAELVKGQEHQLVARLDAVVRRESIVLDLGAVERVDAAGLAALITLYAEACQAGHSFTLSRPNRHVREILKLVGLDKILLAQPDAEPEMGSLRLQESAA